MITGCCCWVHDATANLKLFKEKRIITIINQYNKIYITLATGLNVKTCSVYI